jgi:hypothetical protein
VTKHMVAIRSGAGKIDVNEDTFAIRLEEA